LEHKIHSNNINSILAKGFTLVMQNNKIVRRKEEYKEEESTKIKFFDGEIKVN
jgi:exonuclease VII large subunit